MNPTPSKQRNEQLNAALNARARTIESMCRRQMNRSDILAWLRDTQRIKCKHYQLARFLNLNARQINNNNNDSCAYDYPRAPDIDRLMERHRLMQKLPQPGPAEVLAHLMKLNHQLIARLFGPQLSNPDPDHGSIKLGDQLLRTAIACERSSQQAAKSPAQGSKPAPASTNEAKPQREDGWQRKRIQEMAKAAFRDVEELEASGEIVIPEP